MRQAIWTPLPYVERAIIKDGPPVANEFITIKRALKDAAIKEHFNPLAVHLTERIKLAEVYATWQLKKLKFVIIFCILKIRGAARLFIEEFERSIF